MTATTGPYGAAGASGGSTQRIEALSERVRGVRSRAAGGNLDRWLLIIGGTLMPLGVLLILLGWLGASRTPLPFEQNDYLISGGILGLALVIGGGFVYFAYWQTVRVRDSRAQTKATLDALQRIEELLGGRASTRLDTAAPSPIAQLSSLVATSGGSMYHRPTCAAVAGRDDLREVDASSTSLKPCRICTPDQS